MNWYLIKSKPNSYRIALQNLRQQNFEVFMPLIRKTSKFNQKFITKTHPLFPSYFFLGTSLKPPSWNKINFTRGVSKVVTLDGIYRPISNAIVDGLKNRCDPEGILRQDSSIEPGDKVKIENGPFSDFICQVEKIENEKRVWVLIQFMEQQARTTIALKDLAWSY